jgi:gliding motility-associated-like protein
LRKSDLYKLFILLLCWPFQIASAQTFECDDYFYLALSSGDFEPSALYQMNAEQISNSNTFTLLEDNYNIPLEGLAYNVRDKYLYGINPDNYHVLRIDAFGGLSDLGVPENLDTINLEYRAGCFSPTGNRYIVIGRDKTTGIDKEHYSIRINEENIPASYLALNSLEGTRLDDIAYDPIYGDLYGFDALNKRLVTLDLSGGNVVTYQSTILSEINSLGALFFDDKGVLYGYGSTSGEENTLFQFDKFQRTIIETYAGPSGSFSDGCACPYRIQFLKKPSTHEVVPCSEFTMTYLTHNTAGSSYTQKTLIDSFPDHFTITEIIRPPVYGNIESGIGTNKLHVSGMDVLLRYDSIVIKVEVGAEASGGFTSYAILDGFPEAFGGTIYSDDVIQSEEIEPTTLQVLTSDLLLDETIIYLCDDAVLEYGTFDLDLTYLWSNGSVSSSIEIVEPGLYWVEISNDCVTMRDTIFVERAEEPLNLSLGEDLDIDIGESMTLEFETNASTNIWTRWEAEDESYLSCTDCPNPIYSPTSSGVVSLTIGDTYGCLVSDEVVVAVNKEFDIYVPNIFSPNNDGMNDLFFIQGKFDFDLLNFVVFNRWGSAIHSISEGTLNSLNHGWDGTYKGDLAPEGIYLWMATVQLPDGTIKKLNGDVSLVR